MPVQVRDASAGTVLFDVDAAAAQALLPDAFEVAETAPGRANLAIALVDYRDNDLGAYLEVGAHPVRAASCRRRGRQLHRAPARSTSAFTCEAGRRIWGFPKTRPGDRPRATATASTTWTLRMDGELVLRLAMPRGRRRRGAAAADDLVHGARRRPARDGVHAVGHGSAR